MTMQLKKDLNSVDLYCIATGAMISSGIFILPGIAHAKAGPAVVLSYLLAGILSIAGILSTVELATAMPKSGGLYYFITRALGTEVGALAGILSWLSISFKTSFALVGMAAFAKIFIDININIQLISIFFCLIFIAINIKGIKEASKAQFILVVGLLALMTIYIVLGVPAINPLYFEPFAPAGIFAIFATAGFVFVSYGGLLEITSIAGEIKNPGIVIPKSLIYSTITVIIFYSGMVFVTSGILDPETLHNTLTPVSDASEIFLGHWGQIALSIAAILAFVTTVNAGIMSASRYPMALSMDGLMPKVFARLSTKSGTPVNSIIFTGIIIIASLFMPLELLVSVASAIVILPYILACIANIVFRTANLRNYQPTFTAPLYPWMQIVGIASYSLLIFGIGAEALLISTFIVISGFIIFHQKKRDIHRDCALHHILEKDSDKKANSSLEAELEEIIRERDKI